MSLFFEPPNSLEILINFCQLFIISTHKIWKSPFEFVHFHHESWFILNTVVEDFLTQFTLLHYYPRHYLCIAFCVIRELLHMYILLAKKIQQTRQGKKLARLFSICLMQPLQICTYQERFSQEKLGQVTFLLCCVWCKDFLFYQSVSTYF